jgi:glucokinase
MSEDAYMLGIDLGGTKILSVCLDADFKDIGRDLRPTDARDGPERVIERMVESGSAAAAGRQLVAVGVSAPGPSNPDLGIVTTPPNLPGWHDVPLASLISTKMGLPVWIENDANAGAAAEHRIGAGRGSRHMILVALGTGIGGGLILDGRLYHGASGGAGEIGHMQLDIQGRHCTCGRRGCLEALASGWALDLDAGAIAQAEPEGAVAQFARRESVDPDARILDLAADAGDASATQALQRAGRFLGAGLTNLVNIFNPELIVIGGSLRKSKYYMETALAVVNEEAFPQHRADVRFVDAQFGDEAPAVGAALLALERLREKRLASPPPP